MEDYKKKYEDALERAKSYQKWNKSEVITAIFPELKENEDEKIRKAIRTIILSSDTKQCQVVGVSQSDMFAWLEKQGQKLREKPRLETAKEVKIDNQNCTKPVVNVEPKFKVGDWVVWEDTGSVYQIKDCIEHPYNHKYGYDLTNGGYLGIDRANHCHLWTIQDAEDGDVLVDYQVPFGNPLIFILKKFEYAVGFSKPSNYTSYCFLTAGDKQFFEEGTYHHKYNIEPATKEQRELLFQKMKEAGYEWDDDKKELNKIEQKPAEWSEEDENMFGSIRSTLSMYMNNLSLPKEIRDIHKEELKWFDELYDRGLS